MPPFIPGEITDAIISLAWHNKRTLCACCLVCQSWLPASWHHLFSTINLAEATYDKLVERVLRQPHMCASLTSVYEVRVVRRGKQSDYPPELLSRKWSRFLYDFSGHLPNLAEITLYDVDFRLAHFNFRHLEQFADRLGRPRVGGRQSVRMGARFSHARHPPLPSPTSCVPHYQRP